jgi:hypothetical protein
MTQAQIEYCVDQKHAGKSFGELKKEFLTKGMSEAEIIVLFKEADKHVLEEVHQAPKKGFSLPQGLLGYTLMFLGLGLTLFSFLAMNGSGFIFWYGPILAGSGILMRLRSQKLRQTRDRIRSKSGSIWR